MYTQQSQLYMYLVDSYDISHGWQGKHFPKVFTPHPGYDKLINTYVQLAIMLLSNAGKI